MCLLFCFFPKKNKAQSAITLRQYYHVPHQINPAFAGIEDYWSFHAGYRRVQLPEANTSQTMFLAANLTFPYQRGKTPYMNSNSLMSSKPDLQAKLQQLVANRVISVRSGLGISLQQQRIEISEYVRTEAQLAYGVHVPINRKLSVSGGIMGSLLADRMDMDSYHIREVTDPRYLELVKRDGKSNLGALQAGVSLQGLLYYLGYSFGTEIKAWGFSDNDQKMHHKHIFSAGFKWPVNQWLTWYNSAFAMLGTRDDSYVFFSRVDILNRFRVGGMYSPEEHASVLAAVYFHPVKLDYSYSTPLANDVGTVPDVRMHEITMTYFLFRSDFGSRYFW